MQSRYISTMAMASSIPTKHSVKKNCVATKKAEQKENKILKIGLLNFPTVLGAFPEVLYLKAPKVARGKLHL
jgi:hypothetical protein